MRKLLAIAAGMLCIGLGGPAAAGAAERVEGENFTPTAGKTQVVTGLNSALTSEGALLLFKSNSTAQTSLDGGTTGGTLTAALRGGQACGPERPEAVVRVNGTQTFAGFIDPLGWTLYPVGNLQPGPNSIEVSFVNDYFEPRDAFSTTPPKTLTCDLNLRLDYVDFQASEDPPPPPPPPPSGDVDWIAGADSSDPLALGRSGEWSAISCASSTRRSVTTAPALKGRAWVHTLQDGDDSYGERCESSQGNTSSSNLHPDRLYNEGDQVWIAFALYIPDGFTFCSPSDSGCHTRGDGGLITQEKQLGSCGTPAAGIVAVRPDGTDSSIALRQRNSAETDCGNASMKTLWHLPIQRNRWVKVIRHFHFQPNSTGWIETYADVDGNATNEFVAVPPSLDGVSKTVQRVSSPFGGEDGYRILTWTQKSGSSVDHPSACVSDQCSHQRIGIYRDPDVDGNSIVYHDSVVVGPDVGSVVAAAF